jgi:hypothetical protein
MSVRSQIIDVFKRVAQEQDRPLGSLSDDMPLLESGLDSLGFAILVSRLEMVLGVDPFSENTDTPFPVNLRDLVRLYEHAAPM